jgi:hypothetical protein
VLTAKVEREKSLLQMCDSWGLQNYQEGFDVFFFYAEIFKCTTVWIYKKIAALLGMYLSQSRLWNEIKDFFLRIMIHLAIYTGVWVMT